MLKAVEWSRGIVPAVCGVALLASVAGTASARDEDGRKKRDFKPAVVAAPITGRAIPSWELRRSMQTDDPLFDAKNVTLLSWLPVGTLHPGAWGAADCWGYTSPSGREYALICLSHGTSVVEVTDPVNPVIVDFVEGPESLWRDVAVSGHYMYMGSEAGDRIQVVDLSDVDSGVVRFVGNKNPGGGFWSTHTLLPSDNPRYIYSCGSNIAAGGLVAIDLLNPEAPVLAGSGWTTHYVHEALIVTYTTGPWAGHEIAFCFTAGPSFGYGNNESGLDIIDVTNKASMVRIGQTHGPLTDPNIGFYHQGWLSGDGKYLFLDDEGDEYDLGRPTETKVFDVSDLTNPKFVTSFGNGLTSIDHNQYTARGLVFQSNYTTGLRVWDATDPFNPVEHGFIDTRPEEDSINFRGNWGNYPLFDSGTIIISDMQRGLIVVKVECYADCDTSTGVGTLDFFDFICFQDRFSAADPYACECDESSGAGVCDFFDFICFQDAFAEGCKGL